MDCLNSTQHVSVFILRRTLLTHANPTALRGKLPLFEAYNIILNALQNVQLQEWDVVFCITVLSTTLPRGVFFNVFFTP